MATEHKRGWMWREVFIFQSSGDIFLLTSPFIEQVIRDRPRRKHALLFGERLRGLRLCVRYASGGAGGEPAQRAAQAFSANI